MIMFHHQLIHRFGGCCRGRHCYCVAVLLYFPALPNRIDFCFGDTTVRLNQRPLRAHVKNWPAFPRSLLSHIKNKKRTHQRLLRFPGQSVTRGRSGAPRRVVVCAWRELGLWRARSTATSRQLDLPTGLVGSDSVKRQFRWRSRARGSRGRLRRGDCSYLHIGPAASDEAPRC